jgi:hypothetical protein
MRASPVQMIRSLLGYEMSRDDIIDAKYSLRLAIFPLYSRLTAQERERFYYAA